MSPIRLSSFIFMILFTLLEARDFTHKQPNYQGILETKVAPQNNHVAAGAFPAKGAKEIMFDAFEKEIEGIDMKLRGRKLADRSAFEKEKVQAKVSVDGRSSEISGRTTTTPRMRNSQATLEDKNRKGSAKEVTSVSNAKQHKSKKRGAFDDSFQKLESRDLEAANEVWTLMNKDYPGYGKPRHTPPINNR